MKRLTGFRLELPTISSGLFEYPDAGLEREKMTRFTGFSSPLLLGFDELERVLDRATKATNDGYPPYNIERLGGTNGSTNSVDIIRITLAVAGFTDDDLDITVEENQLTIRGRQTEEEGREYLHRGIAARQFQRAFVLAEGIEIDSAELANGLLEINLVRPEPERIVRKITIISKGKQKEQVK